MSLWWTSLIRLGIISREEWQEWQVITCSRWWCPNLSFQTLINPCSRLIVQVVYLPGYSLPSEPTAKAKFSGCREATAPAMILSIGTVKMKMLLNELIRTKRWRMQPCSKNRWRLRKDRKISLNHSCPCLISYLISEDSRNSRCHSTLPVNM